MLGVGRAGWQRLASSVLLHPRRPQSWDQGFCPLLFSVQRPGWLSSSFEPSSLPRTLALSSGQPPGRQVAGVLQASCWAQTGWVRDHLERVEDSEIQGSFCACCLELELLG